MTPVTIHFILFSVSSDPFSHILHCVVYRLTFLPLIVPCCFFLNTSTCTRCMIFNHIFIKNHFTGTSGSIWNNYRDIFITCFDCITVRFALTFVKNLDAALNFYEVVISSWWGCKVFIVY